VRLYKYLSSDRWKDILKDNLIRFTQASSFNDPFELKPSFEITEDRESLARSAVEEVRKPDFFSPYIEQAYNQLPPETRNLVSRESLIAFMPFLFSNAEVEALMPEALEGLTAALTSGMYQGFDSAVGILSLTTDPKNRLMWAHYAQSHQGLVIELDGAHPFFNQRRHPSDEFGYLREVVYQAERPQVIISELEDLAPILLTKSEDWRYEAEWRMLRPLTGMAEVKEFRGEKIYLFTLPPSCIKRVIVGYRMHPDQRKEITDFLKADERYTNVEIEAVVIDERQFILNFKPIGD
jgi:DUF2971 family protein